MLWSMLSSSAQAQPATWGFVSPMIQKLDAQLENFAATQYPSPEKVLIARASIRTRVLARDLLASGVSDPSDVGMTMVFYGTMIYENLNALDNLYNQLPDLKAMEQALVTPTEHQRRTYILLKPALERFSLNPISKLRLNVLYPGQVRVRVSQAFAPLADALDAANLPLIRNVWQEQAKSLLRAEQISQLCDRFDALTLEKKNLPVKQILERIRPALEIQEFRPSVCEAYQLMSQVVHVLEILQKQQTTFMQARPLIYRQLEAGLANYQQPASRATGLGQLELVLAFEDVITRLDQLLNQSLDTLIYEQLLAQIINQADRGRIEPMHQWLYTILDNWYHIRRFNHPDHSAFKIAYAVNTTRWEDIRRQLGDLTVNMVSDLPLTLGPQHEQWLAECRNTRQLFDDLAQLQMLIVHQSHGRFEPIKITTDTLLTQMKSEDNAVVQQAYAQLLALARQWQQAIDLSAFIPGGMLQANQKAIRERVDVNINQWIKLWQAEVPNPDHAAERLKPALALMRTSHLLDTADIAARDGLFSRTGLIDLDTATCQELLALVNTPMTELARLFTESRNPQDLKLNQQRSDEDLSFVLALGRIAQKYQNITPTNLDARASHVLNRLIWFPGSGEYDPPLTKLCTQMCLTAREWTYQRQQDDPRHRRELLRQLREVGNKILMRLDELE